MVAPGTYKTTAKQFVHNVAPDLGERPRKILRGEGVLPHHISPGGYKSVTSSSLIVLKAVLTMSPLMRLCVS